MRKLNDTCEELGDEAPERLERADTRSHPAALETVVEQTAAATPATVAGG